MWEVLSQSLMLISKRDTWCWTCHSYFRSQQSIKRVNNYCISTVFLSFCGSAVKDWYALAADVSPSVRPPFRCHISTNAVNTSVISVINTLRRWYCVDNSCSVTRDRPPPIANTRLRASFLSQLCRSCFNRFMFMSLHADAFCTGVN